MLPTCSSAAEQLSLKLMRLTKNPGEIVHKIIRRNVASSGSADEDLNTRNRTEGHPPPPVSGGYVRSWQIHSYGGISELQLSTAGRIPIIKSPHDVLVKVHAASVNPIDLAMTKGYGAETLNVLRGLCDSTDTGLFGLPKPKLPLSLFKKTGMIEFPLTLGRDFAGTVVEMGHGARGKYGLRIGDEVYGVVGVQRQGSHADYVLASVDTIRRKPKNLSFIQAASLPYVGLTAWSAIKVTGSFSNLSQKKFLVLGGSGGVGTFAVQYLKSQGAHVVTTCSTDAVPTMVNLGCDFVIDYKQPDVLDHIQKFSAYDCILDLTGPTNTEKSLEATKYLKSAGQFITLSPPFLSNIDKFGLVGGTVKNFGDLLNSNIKTWNKGNAISKWAFFIPNGSPLETFADLIERQQIHPIVQEEFKFVDIPAAFKKMEEGHLRGKIVIDMTD